MRTNAPSESERAPIGVTPYAISPLQIRASQVRIRRLATEDCPDRAWCIENQFGLRDRAAACCLRQVATRQADSNRFKYLRSDENGAVK